MLGRTYWWGSHKIKRVTPVSFLVSSHGVSDLTSETLNIFDQIKHLSACLWGTQLSWQFERNRGILFCRWPNNETGFCLFWFHLPGRRNFFSYFGQIFRTVASHIAKCRDSPKYCGSRRKNETCLTSFFWDPYLLIHWNFWSFHYCWTLTSSPWTVTPDSSFCIVTSSLTQLCLECTARFIFEKILQAKIVNFKI